MQYFSTGIPCIALTELTCHCMKSSPLKNISFQAKGQVVNKSGKLWSRVDWVFHSENGETLARFKTISLAVERDYSELLKKRQRER